MLLRHLLFECFFRSAWHVLVEEIGMRALLEFEVGAKEIIDVFSQLQCIIEAIRAVFFDPSAELIFLIRQVRLMTASKKLSKIGVVVFVIHSSPFCQSSNTVHFMQDIQKFTFQVYMISELIEILLSYV